MYQTKVSAFFTFGRKPKLRHLDVEVNGYRDDDAVRKMKDSLNEGKELEFRSSDPFYYFVGSLFKEYRKLIDRLGR